MRTGDKWRRMNKKTICSLLVVGLAGVGLWGGITLMWARYAPVSIPGARCFEIQASLDLETALLCESESKLIYYVYFTSANAGRAEYTAGRFPCPTNGFLPYAWREAVKAPVLPFAGKPRNGIHVGDMYLLWMPPTEIVFLDSTLQRVALVPIKDIINPDVTNRVTWTVTRKGLGLRSQVEADHWEKYYQMGGERY